ncbi:PREDICTED: uncharacterized protein LOC109186803 [Ipomoea nil]|uniref:uncharacterized protein LOC109186803 n=1 Tax=Ipomoea nil TaxID=35883 RepID=UPI0009010649|nr:PREDICTED: uncharacterized protein LOC109186803 [Ipomoea nil]
MAKTRDRRLGPSTSRRNDRPGSSANQNNEPVKSRTKPRDRKLISFYILFFIIFPAISVFVYRKIYSPATVSVVDSRKPYLYQHELVKPDLNYHEVLTENSKVSEDSTETRRHFQNPVLAYITPWNSKGYNLAKKFCNKFTHLSPVWYELKSKGTDLVLDGRHNADKGWISEIRMKGDALILPRVVLEAIPMDLLKRKGQREKAIRIIIAECKEMEYDGIVLESWSRWAAYGILHDPDTRNKAVQFIRQLGEAMHSVNLERNMKKSLELVYVIGPPHSDKLQEHDFGPEDLRSLGDTVDGFSLMTYDFSGPQSPGPNAPLNWIHSILQLLLGARGVDQRLARKIFLGINFYGNDFVISGGLGGGPIIAHEYISLLEKHKPALQWEGKSGEHFFLYADDQHARHVVFYPTLMSLAKRLEVAASWGAGISIWEIGQGLDSFLDILYEVRTLVHKGIKIYAMEAVNALRLTPLSVLSERRNEPRKIPLLPSSLPFKSLSSSNSMEAISRNVKGGLVLLSSVMSSGLAKALTYEEALQQTSVSTDFDPSGVMETVTTFAGDNPVIVAGGVAILAVPLLVSQLLSKPKPWGVESAKTAYAKLADDANAQLLDIRPARELKEVGSPDIRGLKKKPVTVSYNGEDKPGFLKKLSLKFKEPENTTLFILDKFDGSSELVAELVTENGFKAAYAIKDGAEGGRGWMNSSLPWALPKKTLGLDLSSLTDSFGEGIDAVTVGLGVAAAAGIGALAFSEVETILQLLGSAAIIQVFSKKLLFAEDRKKTLEQVDEFLNTKVAPKELVDEIKQIGKALLPTPVSSKALPAPTEESPPAAAESVSNVSIATPKEEAAPPVINSVAKTEVVQAEEAPTATPTPRPLSPYPNYPDFKPPSSPMPSQP